MTEPANIRKLDTAEQMSTAIEAIVEKRSIEASESQYDRKVCILAVSAAGDVVRRVPIEGTAIEYGQAVAASLGNLEKTYNDPDGEYTSGRGSVCGVYYDVLGLIDTQVSIELGDVDRQEARQIIIREMAELAHSLSGPLSGFVDSLIKTKITGTSGTGYFLEFSFEATSDREFTMLGKIFGDEYRRLVILEEQLFLISDDDT